MTNYAAKDVDSYIEAAADDAQPHLRETRKAVLAAVPDAEEGIHWGKPFYRRHGMLAGYDAFKKHVTFEIWADALPAEDREALEKEGYKTAQRSFQIRFDQPVPTAIIKRIVRALAKGNEAKAKG